MKLADILPQRPVHQRVYRGTHDDYRTAHRDYLGEIRIVPVLRGAPMPSRGASLAEITAEDWSSEPPKPPAPEMWLPVSRVQARNLLSKGRVIRRKSWTDPGQNLAGIHLNSVQSVVYRKSGLWCNCLHRLFDKTANDWEVLKEP